MIQSFTEYVAGELSLTLGTDIFSRRFKTFTGTACCLYYGRYSPVGTEPAALVKREVIVEGRAESPADAEAITQSVCDLLINKSNIDIPGVSKYVTVTGSFPRELDEMDARKNYRYVAELVVTLK